VGDDAGLAVARGVGEAKTGGVGLECTVETGVGAETLAGVVRAIGSDAGVGETGGAGIVTGLALAAAAGGVAVGPEGPEGSAFTNVFEGASGGGVDSAFIFARARSAAGRSVSADQLFSTLVSAMVSCTVCGRFTPGMVTSAGADITKTSPRTDGGAAVSALSWRSRRYRSMGRRLRERISSKFGPWFTTVVFE
jgi:hypothetical protein